MQLTVFQKSTIEKVKEGKSIILIAPTGLGKTLAVTADLQDRFHKIVYGTPLRSLGFGIRKAIEQYKRNNEEITIAIHHGGLKESDLFSEEVVISTYDQIVCGVPGLPLSLPLKAGHAVAGAIIMSRLILDETHLAWAISKNALAILLGIIEMRCKLGLQTIVMTATLPEKVARLISDKYDMELIIAGDNETKNDEALKRREENRKVFLKELKVDFLKEGKKKTDKVDWKPLIDLLKQQNRKRKIYFANTVDRIQEIYNKLVEGNFPVNKIIVLHNRMPSEWRKLAEEKTYDFYSENSLEDDYILLTNQVAEAGLDISSSIVISDAAPVDTLIQRMGRCARWFRAQETKGHFYIITGSKDIIKNSLSSPYREDAVQLALDKKPILSEENYLTWQIEQEWINKAWNGGIENDKGKAGKAIEDVQSILNDTAFALNLFDRAAQEINPGEIARVFREILSVNVAIAKENNFEFLYDFSSSNPVQEKVDEGMLPYTSSISLGKAYLLKKDAKRKAIVIRFEKDRYIACEALYIKSDDILIIPSSIAYLHKDKGLCFKKEDQEVFIDYENTFNESEWFNAQKSAVINRGSGTGYQSLKEHTLKVTQGVYSRFFKENSIYRKSLFTLLGKIESAKAKQLLDIVANLIVLAAAFHDIGKSDINWQNKIKEIDPSLIDKKELIGRSGTYNSNIRLPPHTPPSYNATIKACQLFIGEGKEYQYLIKAIAMAGARHHSSLLNPAKVKGYNYNPDNRTVVFIKEILEELGASDSIVKCASEIMNGARSLPQNPEDIPLLFPNDDLFAIYALAGRAILIADREDASGQTKENYIV